MRDRLCRAIVLTLAATALIGGCEPKTSPREKPALKIGADLTLTGEVTFWSEHLRRGIDLALAQVNAGMADAPRVTVVYEDNQFKPSLAVSAWDKLVTVDKVSIVIACHSPISIPLRDKAARDKVPLLATVTSAEDFGAANEWSFRDFILLSDQCPVLADYAVNVLGIKTVGALTVNDDYGRDALDEFRKDFQKLDGKVLVADTFESSDTTMRTQALKMIESGADAVYVVGRDKALGLAVKQLYEQGYKGRILGINGFDSKTVFEIVGKAGDGAVFTSAYIDLSSATGQAFRKAYSDQYGEEPDYPAVYGYTICKYLADLLLQTGPDSVALRKELATLDVDSLRGRLRMTVTRDVVSPIAIFSLKSGEKKLVRGPQ